VTSSRLEGGSKRETSCEIRTEGDFFNVDFDGRAGPSLGSLGRIDMVIKRKLDREVPGRGYEGWGEVDEGREGRDRDC